MGTGYRGRSTPVPGYVIRDLISAGDRAEIWRGEPEGQPGRVVAIKRVTLGDADLDAVRRAADTLAQLSHPGILAIQDIVADGDGGVAVVSGYATGGSLADRLRRRGGGLPDAEVAELGIRLGEALIAGHQAGIVHGRVRPTSVLYDAEGRPLLAAFGAAHLGKHRGPSRDEAADVRGLAATLFEAVTGAPPLGDDAAIDDDAVSGPDRGLMATIRCGLHGDPADRFDTIESMLSHLDQACGRLDAAATSAAHSRPEDTAAPKRRLRRRTLDHRGLAAVATLIVAIAVVIGGSLLGTRGGAAEPPSGVDADDPDTAVGADYPSTTGELPETDNGASVTAEDAIPRNGAGSDEIATTTPDPARHPRQPAPPCADAVSPTSTTVTQAVDVDGRGCTVPAAWDRDILEVALAGDLYRFDLPGSENDVLLFGDFNCDGRETPALYRPSSGDLFVFPTLTPDREITVTAEPDAIPDATPQVAIDAEGCASVELTPPG